METLISFSHNHNQYHYGTVYNYSKENNYRPAAQSLNKPNRFTKSQPKKRSIPKEFSSNSELWAGPTYFNSPPPSSLPIPKFSLKVLESHSPKRTMEASSKYHLYLFALLLVLIAVVFENVNGAGECGNVPVLRMVFRMVPCLSASEDSEAAVSAQCCSAVKQIGQSPSCLCAVLLSDMAKSAGVKPEVAITIPKRCDIADRPVGYKCGAYTLP